MNIGFDGGFNLVFGLFPFFFLLFFIAFFGFLIYNLVRGAKQYRRNEASPVLTVEASIVAKRMDVSHYHSSGDNTHHHHSSTTYYATFQVESGDRIELMVGDREYGMLVEGDQGRLTFQGTRYQGFSRKAQ